jgi:hypothetical protein
MIKVILNFDAMIRQIIQINLSLLRKCHIFTIVVCGSLLIHSNVFCQDCRISYDKGLITLLAVNADIKAILSGISEKTNIFIQFPKTLDEQITIELAKVPLRHALSRLLKWQDYAVIYSASKKPNRNLIAKVYVLPEQWGSRKPSRFRPRNRHERRIERSLNSYRKRLDSLRSRLSRVDRGSSQERRILRQIRLMEKAAERLEKRLRR